MVKTNWEIIQEDEFSAFEEVRSSGATNMWDTRMVAELTDDVITRDQVLTIISNYDELMKKYPQVREI
tara:strand:+ start:779 stop:982 length:204 start_codon:yes stop_codon:yes gene_type:complete